MLDLQEKINLPVSLNENGLLEFRPPMEAMSPARRTSADMKNYLADSNATFEGESVYDMYRDICLPQDKENIKKAGLRFDITVFHPGMLGREYCKTIGHYHPYKPGTKVRYPETYEVISGNAIFLMQRMDDSFNKLLDVYAVEVKEKEDVIFLPGFAHFLINATDRPLVTSNWSGRDFESLYEPVAKFHGAAYYLVRGADGQPQFIQNINYKDIPPLIKLGPKELPQFGLINDQPAYITGQKTPDMLQFLIAPELYQDELSIENCYYSV
jgi:glucose-6-phosphate isomerase